MAQSAFLPVSEEEELPPPDLLIGGSLFLDFDGTLVDIAPRPDSVAVDPALRQLVRRLAERLQGRLAIVSGRPRRDLEAFLGSGHFALSGSHGLELRRADGRITIPDVPDGLDEAVSRMRALAAAWPGVLAEEKPFGAALHYRGVPRAEEACRQLAEQLAAETGLVLQAGKMVFELRHPDGDKGRAVRTLMDETPMRGTQPIFIGDDLTDEHGFAAARGLGGHGILVGTRRATAADYRLRDVPATLAWLTAAVEAVP